MNRRQFLEGTLFGALLAGLNSFLPAQAATNNHQSRVWRWRHLGGDPRDPRGIHSWERYQQWWNSQKGINDRGNVKLDAVAEQHMTRLVNSRYRSQDWYRWPNGWQGRLYETVVCNGDVYQVITFNRNGRIEGTPVTPDNRYMAVQVQVDWADRTQSGVYRVEVKSPQGVVYLLDTFQVCANAGLSIHTVTVPPPTYEQPPSPPDSPPPRPRFEYSQVGVAWKEPTFKRSGYDVRGTLPIFAEIIGRWLGATRISNVFSGGQALANGGNPQSSSSSSGSATAGASAFTGPVNVHNANTNQINNANTQQQQTINSLQNLNNNGPGNQTGTTTGAGSQETGTIQDNR